MRHFLVCGKVPVKKKKNCVGVPSPLGPAKLDL